MMGSNIESCPVLGVRLTATDYNGALDAVRSAVESGRGIRLNFCNVHVTMLAQSMPELMDALNHPDALTLPDGMPLVWAMRSWGENIRNRVYGPDFFELCMSKSVEYKFRHFFYGSTDDTLEKLKKRLRERFSGIIIVGSYSPPFKPLTDGEEADVVQKMNESGADIVWVALGAPKQEVWAGRMADKLSAPVVAAVGAAFDFHAGTVKQAPDWMQDHGLEWLYRLIQEPGRLWFRYCYYNPLFVLKFAFERLFSRRNAVRR